MKKVNNPIFPKKVVSNFNFSIQTNSVSIELNSHAGWVNCVRIGKFTNQFHNEQEVGKVYFQLVTKLLPFVKEQGERIKHAPHCHLLSGEKRELAVSIALKLHNLSLDDETEVWQLSAGEGIRMIAVITINGSENVYPLFLDPHHLIYPDKKHNQMDYSKKACHFTPNKFYS
ncbi:hypothetical protein [Lentilactobacillus parabuchneri]|uniref:hypothetical protein n=1 Tax=Lentilactobacillus parabuchneri TaxID=152331 RepID=UPI000A1116BB|nr:hypothetical protein [Lentilactobacillus parabuchneri]ORN12746.1 hypothetical protein FAM23164_02374 [Lentilactobacillus parabuchneri]ORN14636.1 hypothetical protein FAM23165_02382 [Lentilactobacillus parabuchneri]ORN17548.1 hypothetical protein FAM23166_02359 [Lentilactobacillus parabuchneri]ORN23930.1 hypothetical protein FAM23167_02144 [Lentilactobacillus parabuchneri]